MADGLYITGLTETQDMIRELPNDLRGGIATALVAAGSVVQAELRKNAPRRNDDEKSEFPSLSSSLVTDIEVDPNGVSIASTGFGDAGPVALWNEYGHRIVTHAKVDTGKTSERNPFMRRSTDNCADDAIDAFCDSIIRTVEKR